MLETLIHKLDTGEKMFFFGVFCLIIIYIIGRVIVDVVQAFTALFEKRYIYIQKKKGDKSDKEKP